MIWVGTENVQTVRILEDIRRYLNGLDNIVMGQSKLSDEEQEKEVFCSEKVYGQLIVVINKMMGGDSDHDLQRELMENEPGI